MVEGILRRLGAAQALDGRLISADWGKDGRQQNRDGALQMHACAWELSPAKTTASTDHTKERDYMKEMTTFGEARHTVTSEICAHHQSDPRQRAIMRRCTKHAAWQQGHHTLLVCRDHPRVAGSCSIGAWAEPCSSYSTKSQLLARRGGPAKGLALLTGDRCTQSTWC